jgi:hypothetical protein
MEEKNKYQLKKVKFYNATLPTISEIFGNKDWVFYGQGNTYPNFLIDVYNNSAIHKSIVQAKVSQIVGDGLYCETNPMATINLVNKKENIQDVYEKCALDLVLFGGYAVNVVWKRDRSEGIAEIHHIDFSRVRCAKIDEGSDEDEVTSYYYSADWTNTRKNKPVELPAFNIEAEDPSQILYVTSYQPSNDYYPSPDYSGALAAIDISIEIQNFHKNNLKNGMMPSLFINFNNGVPGPEEQDIITRALEESYGGTDNGGRAVVSFNESKESGPTIEAVQPNQSDNYYTTIYEDIIRSILSGHRVSSGELFGISSAGKLGSANEILEHSEFFRNTVIKPYINELISTFNKLMSLKTSQPIMLKVKPLTILDVEKVEIKDEKTIIE